MLYAVHPEHLRAPCASSVIPGLRCWIHLSTKECWPWAGISNQFLNNQTGKKLNSEISTYQPAYNHFPVVIASTNYTTYFGQSKDLKMGISWTIWQHTYLTRVHFKGMGGGCVWCAFIIFLGKSWDKETLRKPIPFHTHLIIQPYPSAEQGTRQRQESAVEFKHPALVFPQACAWFAAPDGSL